MIGFLDEPRLSIGAVAEGQKAIDRLLLILLGRCPLVSLSKRGKVTTVILRAPHRLADSDLLTGLLSLSQGGGDSERATLQARCAKAACGCDLPAIYRRPLEKLIANENAVTVALTDEGVTITLAGATPTQRALVLSELYVCTKPDEAPYLWWSDMDQKRLLIASYPCESGDALPQIQALTSWTNGVGLPLMPVAFELIDGLIGGIITDSDEATRLLVRLIQETGRATVGGDQAELRVHPPHADHIPLQALEQAIYWSWFLPVGAGAIIRRVAQYESRPVVRREGGELVLQLDALNRITETVLKWWPYNRMLRWYLPHILFDLYRRIGDPEQPRTNLLFSGGPALRIGWPSVSGDPAAVAEVAARWRSLTGREALLLC